MFFIKYYKILFVAKLPVLLTHCALLHSDIDSIRGWCAANCMKLNTDNPLQGKLM
jgi:hypothetical protein